MQSKGTKQFFSVLMLTGLALMAPLKTSATEGMWIPALLQAVEGDMQSMGLKLSAEDIYSINRGSLKDAIVHFGGGCTASMISQDGLLLTNHHCGYAQIQTHSSLENDYLRDGFWAMDRASELMNPDLTATFIVRIEDVTEAISAARAEGEDAETALRNELIAGATNGTPDDAVIRDFLYGNQHFLIVSKTYRDVRLVGAPPSAIGKFGGDTDNWMWPRHTGDFSLFRIYADADQQPADPNVTNVPLNPLHHLPVSLHGLEEGDFTMVFGFPGRTERYIPSFQVEHLLDVINPQRIAMRTASLEVINAAMAADDATRIAYAAKQSSISNAWKKWIGQSEGLIAFGAVGEKRQAELSFSRKVVEEGMDEYRTVMGDLRKAHEGRRPFAEARSLLIEMYYYGPEILAFARGSQDLIHAAADKTTSDSAWVEILASSTEKAHAFFKDYNPSIDQRVTAALLPLYFDFMPADLTPPEMLADWDKGGQNARVVAEALFEGSVLDDEADWLEMLLAGNRKKIAKLAKDPAFRWGNSMVDSYLSSVRPVYVEKDDEITAKMGTLLRGFQSVYPDSTFWPDANSTMRLTYGKVEGSNPRDAVTYKPFTTAAGILQKYVPGDAEFDLPADMVAQLRAKEFGPYAQGGELRVCFLGSNHTTGGNSGSPTLNGTGDLVGLNFDRTWESTMSDIRFDGDRCRNIMVDVRYILWVIDIYAGATHLVQEMTLTERDPEAIAPGWRPFGEGSGPGRGISRDPNEVRDEFKKRARENMQERRRQMEER
jgi:hypothetical protein